MNKIEINRSEKCFVIDGIPLYEYIGKWIDGNGELLESISPTNELAICWSDKYDFKGDSYFVQFALNQDKSIIPILLCPDDFDFSCVVIVVDIEKFEDKVIWKRIGLVDHSGESFEEEKKSGILYTEAYSKEDYLRYGDNVASSEIDSDEWHKWISENWDEELFRRRINYTFPYYQNEKNIKWFADCGFVFHRKEYDFVVESCYML